MAWVFLFYGRWSRSSSLVPFKNGPVYLTRGTAQVFISLTWFLLCSLVLSFFLVFLRYNFLKFFFQFRMFKSNLWILGKSRRLSIFSCFYKLPLLRAIWFLLHLIVLFLPSFGVFRFSLSVWHIFHFLFLDCTCISSQPV